MISCEKLQKKYRNNEVLKGISFTIEEPKIIGLIGRNGAGKSTLLKMLAGHTKPSAGTISVLNTQPFNNLYTANNTILIDENMGFPPLTLQEILKQAGRFNTKFATDLALELLNYAQLGLNSYHDGLSKGQRSTFNLIYGLASRMQITLLDEPMNGMDEAIRDDFYRAILKEFIAYPRIIIISSHHLNEIEHLIEEILLIDKGIVEIHMPLDEVQQMAVRISGQKEEIEQLLENQIVLSERAQPPFYEAILKTPSTFEPFKLAGINVQPVSAKEVCKLLTQKTTGGIDDVFK